MDLIINNEIKEMLENFHKISGLRIGIHDEKTNIIMEYPSNSAEYDKLIFCDKVWSKSPNFRAKCHRCDAEAYKHVYLKSETYIYTCHCGFYEALVPIVLNGLLVCCFMIEQVRPAEAGLQLSDVIACVDESFVITRELEDSFGELPCMTLEQFKAYVYFLEICARDIYERHSIRLAGREITETFQQYVKEHLYEHIGIEDVAKALCISASHLSRIISKNLNTTFSEYMNRIRIKEAQKLLLTTNMSVTNVALELSYSDPTYFMRVFKKLTGMTCSEFRVKTETSDKS